MYHVTIKRTKEDLEFEINKLHADVYSDCLMDGYTEDESYMSGNLLSIVSPQTLALSDTGPLS